MEHVKNIIYTDLLPKLLLIILLINLKLII
nr:MAG TPA: hypothetical protein [Caudoviricetes sp.]